MRARHQTVSASKKVLIFVLLTFTIFLIAAKAHKSDSAFERIKNAIPQREAGWKIIQTDEHYNQGDGSMQFDVLWANGSEEVSATVILHQSLKAAKKVFKRPPEGEPSMDSFLVDGLGDEAYLYPPIILHQDGPFNLRLRKGRYEISMSANSKDTVKRCARYIIDAISGPKHGIPPF